MVLLFCLNVGFPSRRLFRFNSLWLFSFLPASNHNAGFFCCWVNWSHEPVGQDLKNGNMLPVQPTVWRWNLVSSLPCSLAAAPEPRTRRRDELSTAGSVSPHLEPTGNLSRRYSERFPLNTISDAIIVGQSKIWSMLYNDNQFCCLKALHFFCDWLFIYDYF